MMLKSALFVFIFICFLGRRDCAENQQKTAERGENATLECYIPEDAVNIMLRWRKPDLQSKLKSQELFVFYMRENRPYENKQHPSFKDRVELKDREMKGGNLSVILKNVRINDTGIYECYAGYNKQDPQLMNTINLTVEEPGNTQRISEGEGEQDGNEKDERQKDGRENRGLIPGLIVAAVVVITAAVGIVIYRNQPSQRYQQSQQIE